jgi:HK97 family phage prohead protease
MERAYSFIEWKSLPGEQRLLEGWATRVEPDRALDVVEPRGAVFKLPLPLLMDHDHRAAVGSVTEAKVTDTGIRFKAQIAKITEPGAIKDLCDSAWDAAKAGLRRAVSIGFLPLKAEPLPTGGTRFLSWDWFELSMCSVPCAPGATIDTIKSFDRDILRRKTCRVVRLDKPVGASRKALPVVKLDNAPWLKRETTGRPVADNLADALTSAATKSPILDAVANACDDHAKFLEEVKMHKQLGDTSYTLMTAIAAGSGATDAELADIRERLAKLENKR